MCVVAVVSFLLTTPTCSIVQDNPKLSHFHPCGENGVTARQLSLSSLLALNEGDFDLTNCTISEELSLSNLGFVTLVAGLFDGLELEGDSSRMIIESNSQLENINERAFQGLGPPHSL